MCECIYVYLVDDRGQELVAEYNGVPDGEHIAVILESRNGRVLPEEARNKDYNAASRVLLARLARLDAVLVDALVDTERTQELGVPEAERRLIESPIRLAQVPDLESLRLQMGREQARTGGGARTRRIRLRVDVPGYMPVDAVRLANTLAAPIAGTSEKAPKSSGDGQGEEITSDAAGKRVRLDWTREEIILAMDLYVNSGAYGGSPIPGQGSEPITQLSRLLQELGAYPKEVQGEKYRNPDGVYLKLMNLRAIQTEGAHGMNAYSQLDAAVWREYADNLPRLEEEAEAIRARLREGAIQPAKTVPVVKDVDIEQQNTETYMVSPSGEQRLAVRAEQQLVGRYRDYMAAKGIAVRRKEYLPAGEVRPIYSDVWVEDRRALIEAKNSDSRDALRQAIGQLYDYRRFHQPLIRLAVLLPYPPKAERLDLLQSAGIEALWPHGPGFRDSAGGVFT
jgi:hypothetical protein